MVVDDNTVDCMAVERALRHDSRCTVHGINDTEAALQTLREGNPDWPFIVLLDLEMPRMSGIEFLKELRNDAALREVLVFVLTTSRSEEDRKQAYNLNVAGYIDKQRVTKESGRFRRFFREFLRMNVFPPAPELREPTPA